MKCWRGQIGGCSWIFCIKTRWGVVILTPLFPLSPTTSFCPPGKSTSFILVSTRASTFETLRQRWVIPPLDSQIWCLQFRILTSCNSHIQTDSSVFYSFFLNFGSCRPCNVVMLTLSFFFQCLARVTAKFMGETPVPPFLFLVPLTPGEGPFFQNKHSFYAPAPLS